MAASPPIQRAKKRGLQLNGYKWHLGFLAWFLHRVSGILLLSYLLFHLWLLHSLSQPPPLAGARKVLESTGFLFYVGGIWALFLYHGLNGIRLLLIDSSRAAYYPRVLFWALLGVGLIIFFSGLVLY